MPKPCESGTKKSGGGTKTGAKKAPAKKPSKGGKK